MNETAPTSAALTHQGRVRDHNEDTYGIAEDEAFWCVADGMGGHAGGDVASAVARDVILASIRAGERVDASILAAHDAITKAAEAGKGSPYMGSTVVALSSTGPDYEVSWVGDSRAYLWNGSLSQLSRDHSLVQSMIDSGQLTKDSPKADEIRNVITQCLGPPNKSAPRVDAVSGSWRPGDKIVLCSDGMHGELDDEAISRIIESNVDEGDQAIVDALVDAALEAGGSDNITVVVISAPQDIPQQAADIESGEPGGRTTRLISMLLAVIVLVISLLYLYFR